MIPGGPVGGHRTARRALVGTGNDRGRGRALCRRGAGPGLAARRSPSPRRPGSLSRTTRTRATRRPLGPVPGGPVAAWGLRRANRRARPPAVLSCSAIPQHDAWPAVHRHPRSGRAHRSTRLRGRAWLGIHADEPVHLHQGRGGSADGSGDFLASGTPEALRNGMKTGDNYSASAWGIVKNQRPPR